MNIDPKAHSLRIFVVENHTDTLLALRQYLESLGHKVTTARTLKEAIEKIPRENINVLLSDIALSDGSGWELLQRITLSPNIFAVAMSGFCTTADIERSYQVGFWYHLIKPFKVIEIDKILEEAARATPSNK
ncbi:MAG: hypothetical protein C5B47_08660 [Verrucomicrobia bacterium]|nr:MAG: hypothetical protein C5B47_08660 [Verrucomicrobiota bacterium]